MTSITAGESKREVAQPRQQSQAVNVPQVDVAAPNRREFLYYIWGASMVLLLGQATAGLIWFALPRFKEGTFGGVFNFPPERVPLLGSNPVSEPSGRFWVSNTDAGLVSLYGVCTHLGCLPRWEEGRSRFECPCHGSKFELNGDYIEGPAPRNLDRFRMTVTFEDGTTAEMNDSGDPIPLEGRRVTNIAIDTGSLIRGQANA
ncbi:MAG: Rieske 2Fe-2S domain-containing protein [Chloroflexi bacterium]|nr:Rieske 2Fe-2S domain-containing protein [Chloroflexota bacterium]